MSAILPKINYETVKEYRADLESLKHSRPSTLFKPISYALVAGAIGCLAASTFYSVYEQNLAAELNDCLKEGSWGCSLAYELQNLSPEQVKRSIIKTALDSACIGYIVGQMRALSDAKKHDAKVIQLADAILKDLALNLHTAQI